MFSNQLLQGRVILDCSTLLPGPFLGKLLAQRGARVIKIENPLHSDGAQKMGQGHFYQDLNACKEIISLNLTDPSDIHLFHDWVRKADGLIEGFRPKAKKKLGLDEATLHEVNPNLCIVSLVGYPEEGPWRDRAGHDLNFSAVTGCASLFHEMPALPLADLFCAYEGALSLTAAMNHVARGGKGLRTVVSMSKSLVQVQSGMIREFKSTGQVPKAGQTLFSGKFPCYRIYTTADGKRVAVGSIEYKFWKKVCELLNLSHLSEEGYATGRRAEEVIALVQGVFLSKPWSEWSPLFEEADCCVEPVLDYSEIYSHGLSS